METAPYDVARFVEDLRNIVASRSDPSDIVADVAPLARRLAQTTGWIEARFTDCDEELGFGAHLLHEEDDHTLAVFAASWLPHRGAPPHDHGTWAVVAGVDGFETNAFWDRLDDRSRPGHARLAKREDKAFGPGDVLTMLPGQIHSVTNDGERTTLSLHVYGTHINHTRRSQFDPQRGLELPFRVKVD